MDISKVLSVYDKRHLQQPFGDIVAQKYKSVYIPFQASGLYSVSVGKAMYFRPDPELDCRNAIIKGIQLVCSQEEATNVGWNGSRDNLPVSNLIGGYLYISNTHREVISTLPFHNLIKFANNGKLTQTYFTEQIWQNCYVEFFNVAGITAANGLQFIIYYDEI